MRFFYFLIALFLWTPGFANSIQAIPSASCRPVNFAEIEIVCIDRHVGSFSPLERAEALSRKILNLSNDLSFDPASITVIYSPDSADIVAGDLILLSVHDADATSLKIPREALAQQIVVKMRSAIEKYRLSRRPHTLTLAGIYTLVTVIGFLILLWLVSILYGKIYKKIESLRGTKIRSITIRNYEVLTAHRIISTVKWLAQTSRFIITLILVYFFLPLVFSFFPWTATFSPKLFSYVLDPLKEIFTHAVAFIPNLFFILVIATVTRYVLVFVHFIFKEIERGSLVIPGFYRDWAEPTYKLIAVLVWAFALVMAFPFIPGSSSPAFQGISVFIGLLLSLGSSSAISNMVAGIVITYMRPFRIGDRVKIADTMGDVMEKNLLVTRVKTIKEEEITIPNSMVLGSHIINYSVMAYRSGLILNTSITIGYDAPWPQVHQALIAAALDTPNVLQNPKPFVLQTALNDFHVSYEINAYTKAANLMAQTYSLLHQKIQDSFNKAGIEIMSPSFTALRDGNKSTIPVDYQKTK